MNVRYTLHHYNHHAGHDSRFEMENIITPFSNDFFSKLTSEISIYMQEIEMPRKCCFYPLEEELGRGALIKQKFNYLLSIRNFGRGKVHWPGQRAAGETHHDYFCAKTYFKGP